MGTLGLLFTGSSVLFWFGLWVHRQEHPLIDLAMFHVPILTLTLAVVGATVIVQFGILVFLPLLLETVRQFTALEVGTMLGQWPWRVQSPSRSAVASPTGSERGYRWSSVPPCCLRPP